MAIADINITPLGKETTSMSDEVADVHKLLEDYKDKVKFQLTPTSTILEGDVNDLYQIIQKLHEESFNQDTKRVAVNIRIDDRRDAEEDMNEKVQEVEEKVENK
ncbi:MTH1187 family thiamine-binding protein [Thalassorhabdus alkalitolerans]|uniref:MTH1187 family thiamine-binding protein n=1 Tax=Thalassorhabdus alkalitolerans TaxID=2282697 RepID=A0ABW0YTE9_9BACI|nr:MTH1187 family thiamine-binding protein [Thalassobacillus sp. C254]